MKGLAFLLPATLLIFSHPLKAEDSENLGDGTVEAFLVRRVSIPDEFISPMKIKDREVGYGGDVRVGDLDGDGELEFIVFKSMGGMIPAFIGAFDLEGRSLWSLGDPGRTVKDTRGGAPLSIESPSRPGPVAIHDLDGDGETEVVAFWLDPEVEEADRWSLTAVELLMLEGRTGRVKDRAVSSKLCAADAFVDGRKMEANYVHQRLLLCNLRGLPSPRDFVVKVGKDLFAFDDRFELLWTYTNQWNIYPRHSAYIPTVGDADGDGRDEVFGGNFLLDEDGTPVWERYLGDNLDSVLIGAWDEGRIRTVASAYGQVLDGSGEPILYLGPEAVPHGQEIRLANLREDLSGPELVIRFNGHSPKVMIVSNEGRIVERFAIPSSPNETGIETVAWHGPHEPSLLYAPAALLDGHGRKAISFPGLPPPSGGKMGWYHCIPVDLEGEGREGVVLYDPYAAEVFVYTLAPPREERFRGFRPDPRQYNPRLMD